MGWRIEVTDDDLFSPPKEARASDPPPPPGVRAGVLHGDERDAPPGTRAGSALGPLVAVDRFGDRWRVPQAVCWYAKAVGGGHWEYGAWAKGEFAPEREG